MTCFLTQSISSGGGTEAPCLAPKWHVINAFITEPKHYFIIRSFHYIEHDSSLTDALRIYIVFATSVTSRNNLNLEVKASTATQILCVETCLLNNVALMLLLLLPIIFLC